MNDPAEPTPAEVLRHAAALVFVADLDAPEPDVDEARHLAAVLRLRPGEQVVVADGAGAWRRCIVAESGKGRRRRALHLEVSGPIAVEAPVAPAVAVAFSLVKGERSEWAVQKLTELGVDRLLPFVSARTVVKLDAAGRRARGERLRRIAREAAAQSRRLHLPEVADPVDLAELVGGAPPAELAVADPDGDVLQATTRLVVVGPEGGFAPDELGPELRRLALGPNVLRAETAAVTAGALLTARRAGIVAGGGPR